MIAFLTVIYIVLLQVAFKFKWIKPTTLWKASPVIWVLILAIGLFVPMQFWAPGGKVLVLQNAVPIVPNVSGQVIEISVKPNELINKGDPLFKLDPTLYQAGVNQIQAQLELANARLREAQDLKKDNAISIWEYEQYQAQAKQLKASLDTAEYNLEQTVIRAPADGFVTNLALREGARVSSIPMAQIMTFIDTSDHVIFTQILQSYLRFIEPGQLVEVTFKRQPGKIYTGKVDFIINANATGQVMASGKMVATREIKAMPFSVRILLDDKEFMNTLPAGTVGSIAIYTGQGKMTHIIRKVMIRMDSLTNYFNPS